MDTSLFDYDLPQELIAQQPSEPRDSSRLMVLHRADGQIEHRTFRDVVGYLHPRDLLVANNSRVIPARLHARKATGGVVELFLLRQLDDEGCEWECLVGGKGLHAGVTVTLLDAQPQPHSQPETQSDALLATVTFVSATGTRHVHFSAPVQPYLAQLGEVPLPPYITEYAGDRERYQTVYSQPEGSVAAPTAGLHFTPELLLQIRDLGVQFDTVTLHVGLDTFKPVESEQVESHVIHSEWAELTAATARRINETTLAGKAVIAVGTTTVRTLEWGATGAQGLDPYDAQACPWQRVAAYAGDVNLYIRPGYRYRAVDGLITNFHLPRSSLLMMVSAFVGQRHADDPDWGRHTLLDAYETAKREGYRFYSFGDAMLIL
jgi:S-adenosylmethionine:tRNA ribosyltransferase-isomerase